MAWAGIEMAIWDAHTRLHNTNLVKLLGGSETSVPAYGTIGYDDETGWIRGASMAASRNIPVSSHLWSEISAQWLCLAPTAHWLEYCD